MDNSSSKLGRIFQKLSAHANDLPIYICYNPCVSRYKELTMLLKKLAYFVIFIFIPWMIAIKYDPWLGVAVFIAPILLWILKYFYIKSRDRREIRKIAEAMHGEDFLGKAAECGTEANRAMDAKDYDLAWKKLMEVKQNYWQHANKSGFTPSQVHALDASVHVSLANILRLEGRHKQALVDIIYAYSAPGGNSQAQLKKLRAYFNRCKFKEAGFEDVLSLSLVSQSGMAYAAIRDEVAKWE